VGSAVPLGHPNKPSVTVIVTPASVPLYPRSVQSSAAVIVPLPAVPAFLVAAQASQSRCPSMMLVAPKKALESSRPLTRPSPFRSAPPPMIVGEKPPEKATADAVGIPARKPTTRTEATTNAVLRPVRTDLTCPIMRPIPFLRPCSCEYLSPRAFLSPQIRAGELAGHTLP